MRRFSILLAGGALAVAGTMTAGATATSAPAVALPAAAGAATTAKADFNGDGFSDLAVPVQGESSAGSTDSAGAVHVLYGGAGGVSAAGDQLWSRDSPGVRGETTGGFAVATTTGDFDGDGHADLAVGDTGGDESGSVNVLYGSPGGLTAAGDQLWSADTPGLEESAPLFFGEALAAGDFDGDGDDDLAVGAPFDSGTVSVIQGSPAGLTTAGVRVWDRDIPGVPGDTSGDDGFGWELTVGSFGRGDFDDLVVGVLEEDGNDIKENGAVHVFYGSENGLTTAGNQYWSQDSPGVLGESEFGEFFGGALAADNFGETAEDDLAISTTFDGLPTGGEGGGVNVLYGSPAGLTAQGNQYWSQDSPGVAGVNEPFDLFGSDLAAADFGGSSYADLAIGASDETLGARVEAGAVHVLYGSASGLRSSGSQLWQRDSSGIDGSNRSFASFGETLVAADLGKTGRADLSVAVPGQRVGGETGAGALHLLYGSSTGLSSSGDQVWHQDRPGVRETAEEFDGFGRDDFAF